MLLGHLGVYFHGQTFLPQGDFVLVDVPKLERGLGFRRSVSDLSYTPKAVHTTPPNNSTKNLVKEPVSKAIRPFFCNKGTATWNPSTHVCCKIRLSPKHSSGLFMPASAYHWIDFRGQCRSIPKDSMYYADQARVGARGVNVGKYAIHEVSV